MSDPESSSRSIIQQGASSSSNSQELLNMAVPAGPSSTAALKHKLLTHHNERTRDYSELQPRIMAEILSQLSTDAIKSCQLASKELDHLTTDPQFINLHLKRSKDQILIQPNPSEDNVGVNFFYIVDHQTNSCKAIFDPVSNMKIMCTYDGLLCVKESHKKIDPLWLYNPIIKRYVTLPISEPTRLLTSYVVSLGFDSRSGKYKLVRHYRFERGHKVRRLEILTLGQSSWKIMNCGLPDGHAYRALFCEGYFYLQFIQRQAGIGNIWTLSILVVDSSSEGTEIVHFPYNFSTQPFVEMLDIGGRVILIEHERRLMRKWVLAKRNGEYSFEMEELRDTGVRWTKKIYYETLCQVGVGSYIAKFTTWREDPDRLTRFSPGTGEPFKMLNSIPYFSHGFNARLFKPSFVDPVAAAAPPPPPVAVADDD